MDTLVTVPYTSVHVVQLFSTSAEIINAIKLNFLLCLSAPINYSNYRKVSTATKYTDEFQGTFGAAAPSAK